MEGCESFINVPSSTPVNDTDTKYNVNRKIFTQEEFDEVYDGKPRPSKTLKERVKKKKEKCSCSRHSVWKFIKKYLPFINIMKHYNIKTDLINDIIAGVTVGIMQIPQGMAYALLSNLSPVFGLYTSIFPVIIYFFFGTSRHISLGSSALVSLLLGNAVTLADCESRYPGNLDEQNRTLSLNNSLDNSAKFTDLELCQIGVATSVSLLAGLLSIAMGMLRLGFVTIYLSEPITRGFVTGSAFHVLFSQLKNWFGIPMGRHNGPLKLIWLMREWVLHITEINWCAFIICMVCMVILYITKEFINPRVKAKIKVPVPVELIVVILSTIAVHFGNFDTKYNLSVVGEIPNGIPAPSLPPMDNIGSIIIPSIAIAIVNFAIAFSMAKIFAKKHAYSVDSNQELLALGICNTGSSFLHSFMAGASLSRSSVQEGAGGATQLAGIISAGLLLLVLYFIAPLFRSLPNACLAAVILMALKSMFLQLKDLPMLWKVDKIDFMNWVVACLSTFLLDVEYGLGISIGVGLLSVVYRAQRPYTCVLGKVPNTDLYKNTKIYDKAHEIPGITIFRVEASLYYVNKHNVVSKLYEKTGVNPAKLKLTINKAKKRQAAHEKKKLAIEKRQKKKDENVQTQPCDDSEICQNGVPSAIVKFEVQRPDLKYVIIDCSMMGFVDYDGVSTLTQIIHEYREVGITVYLAGPRAGVRDMLERAGFYKKAERACVFLSVHDAVLTALQEMELPCENNIPSITTMGNIYVVSTKF